SLSSDDAWNLALGTMLESVNMDGAKATRRRFGPDQLDAEQRLMTQGFVDAHLLTSDQGPGGEPVYEIAHEAFLRTWKRLADKMEANQDARRLRPRLELEAHEWLASRDPDALLHGTELRQAAELPLLRRGVLGQFIAESIRSDQEEAERRADAAA